MVYEPKHGDYVRITSSGICATVACIGPFHTLVEVAAGVERVLQLSSRFVKIPKTLLEPINKQKYRDWVLQQELTEWEDI